MSRCLTAVTSHATWDAADQTEQLWTHLKELRDGTGGRTTLKEGTYYVRGQILTKHGQEDLVGSGPNAGRYFLAPPASGPLKIIGAAGVNNSTELTALTTRIVHGVVVGDDDSNRTPTNREVKTWDQLETSDPWRLRFPENVRSDVRWIEFPGNSGGDSFVKADQAHTYETYAPGRQENWPTATYFGIPLRYAEAMVGRDQDFPDYRWTRTTGGTQTVWDQEVDVPFGDSGRPALWFLGNCDWSSDDFYTWGITFHGWDANCGMARVSGINQVSQVVGPSGGPYVGEYTSQVTFANNPFSASTGGGATMPDKLQRFSLMNAPEFLNLPGTMVFNPNNGRIYFIKPTGTGDPADFSNYPIATELNMWMEVSWPKALGGSNFSAPIIIGDKSVQWTKEVQIKRIAFGTGRGCAIEVTGVTGPSASTPAIIDHCLFRNQGMHSVQLNRCKFLSVKNSHFLEGYRGHLYIDAWRNFTREYGKDYGPNDPQPNPFPIDDVRNLADDYIRVQSCTFEKGGLMWPYNGALEMRGWNIGTRVTGCAFNDLSGIAVRIHGAQNIVESNTFTDCVKDVTDYGAIYVGRSLVQIGNIINQNTIQGVKWRGRASQERVANSLEDDVCGIYCDDYICGTMVTFNFLIDCQTGIESNGGRFNLFRRNNFDAAVEYPFRTNVMRQAPGAYDAIGTFRFFDPSEDYYKHSVANQLYTEMRNLYIACKKVSGTYDANYNVFASSTAWQTAQATGAYDTGYASVDTSSRKDLEHLAARLNDSTTGQPTWDEPDNGSPAFTDSSKNSLRRIQYSSAGDWFKTASSALVSGTGSRKWLEEYTDGYGSRTALRNYFNLFRWNECDFADSLKNPALNTTTSNPFFTSYRSWWSWKDDNYMTGDTAGYEATEVPCEAWE